MSVHLVCYTDGSCRGNPGFAGYGVIGYTYRISDKPKNIKHPAHPSIYFTDAGFSKDKGEQSIEVLEVFEVIHAIEGNKATNNEAELHATLCALQKACEVQDLTSVTVITDSNYIVSAFHENLEKWKANQWTRQDGKQIVHITEWKEIDKHKLAFFDKGVSTKLVHVKGHNGDFGNEVADLYSVVASNSARRQFSSPEPHKGRLLDQRLSYQDFKKSYTPRDLVFYFRDLYFGSQPSDDAHYCFLSTSEDPLVTGKRDTSSIFVGNIGYVPDVIQQIKEIYRAEPRSYSVTCCVKLNKLEDKDLYRLAHLVGPRDLLIKGYKNGSVIYQLVRDHTPFMFENTVDYPFIVNAGKLFNSMLDVQALLHEGSPLYTTRDITDKIVKEGKIAFSNRDKHLDLTDLVKDEVTLQQKLLVTVGYDIPSYLALKHIESDIQKVMMHLEKSQDSNFCTLYVNIQTQDRQVYSVNIRNKFLRMPQAVKPKTVS